MDTHMHKTMVSIVSMEKIEIIRSEEFMPSKARLKFLEKMIILGPKTAILGPQICRILVLGLIFGGWGPGPWGPLDPPLENKIIVISKSFHPHVVHVYKQSMHIIRVKPSSCHTWLVKQARVWTKCVLVELCDKMTKICHIYNTWSWPMQWQIQDFP